MARLLLAIAVLVALDGVHAACGRKALRTVDAAQWRVVRVDGGAFVPFVPSGAASFVLDSEGAARVVPSTGDVFLSSSFSRVDELKSDVVTSLTIKAAPHWVHATPVAVAPTAFAQLSNLETLYLQDVPLATKQLHLQLPASIKKIVIVGCKLAAFSFEIIGGEAPTEPVEIDLHANELESIPDFFYSLTSSVVNLDIRLNKLSVISVTTSDLPTLKQWLKRGTVQIDNPKGPCPHPGEESMVRGLSQVFDLCVFEDGVSRSDQEDRIKVPLAGQSADGSDDLSQNMTGSSAQVARDVGTELNAPPATVKPPTNEAALLRTSSPPGPDSLVNTPVSQSASTKPDSSSAYVAIVAGAVVTVLLATMMVAVAAARRRDNLVSKDSDVGYEAKSLTSLFSAAVTEDVAVLELGRRRSSGDSSSSESITVIPLPMFTNQTRSTGRPNPIVRSSSDAVTPIGREARSSQYANLLTPHNDKSQPFVMSRSLQSLIGVSHYTITSLEKENELRQSNKQRLRMILSDLAKERVTIDINSTAYICCGEVQESGVGAFMVRCRPVSPRADSSGSSSPLLLKVYVEQDIRHAVREYRALLVMQSNTCRQFISQIVATEMEKKIEGMLCAALVIEAGTASSFHHVVRGQIDRTQQFEVVQQLYHVIKALECLHVRQFIHGGLHLDALLVHPAEANKLKFRDLEHATRFGDIIQSDISPPLSSLEYMPPEMAHHRISCGEAPRPPCHDTMDDDVYRVLRASPAYDIWCFGIMILKVYANTKQLDEFKDCETPNDFCMKLADNSFNFERSLQFYVHHDDVRDLVRVCLRPDPRKRPRLAGLLSHRAFRAYDRLE